MQNSYLYTETAFHHEGDLDFLLGLIDLTKQSGAKGVKFQVLIEANALISSRHGAFEQLAGYCFSLEQWKTVFQASLDAGLDVIMMPLDVAALELATLFPVKFLELHSVSFYSALNAAIKASGVPLMIGTGGRTFEEIKEKQAFFGDQLQILMMGFQAFPSQLKDLRLGKIALLKREFPSLQIGYADHSAPSDPMAVESNDYARLLGATYFEKHITTLEGVARTDGASAIGGEKLVQIKSRLEFIDSYILGNEEFLWSMTEPEVVYRERQKKVTVNRDLQKGTVLRPADLSAKMFDKAGGFSLVEAVVGKELAQDILQDEILTQSHLAS